ncbi:MAG: aquaporin family protein [Bifidobacteriaceae bacterium]|jgi:glycerol uptake facilitator protein|nr:aquaporin family protein [Bifidobacteriaceae bacterium]
MTDIFIPELIGTATLLVLGVGVVANAILTKTKGFGGGWLMINFGWGFGVFAGVYAAYKSGGHLNPAVTFGIIASGADTWSSGIDIDFASTAAYIGAQFLGAFLGAVIAWAAYKQHYDDEPDPGSKLGTFSTGPAVRSYTWNFVTEVIATFVLVYWVIMAAGSPSGLGPLAVAVLIVGIGASLGGPTGYAINPARDLGPRIAHFVLPIKGKGSSDWGYSWVPVAGPIVGGVIAGLLAQLVGVPVVG